MMERRTCGYTTANQIAACYHVWNMFLHLDSCFVNDVTLCQRYFNFAITVSSPTVACPIFTFISASSGR